MFALALIPTLKRCVLYYSWMLKLKGGHSPRWPNLCISPCSVSSSILAFFTLPQDTPLSGPYTYHLLAIAHSSVKRLLKCPLLIQPSLATLHSNFLFFTALGFTSHLGLHLLRCCLLSPMTTQVSWEWDLYNHICLCLTLTWCSVSVIQWLIMEQAQDLNTWVGFWSPLSFHNHGLGFHGSGIYVQHVLQWTISGNHKNNNNSEAPYLKKWQVSVIKIIQ